MRKLLFLCQLIPSLILLQTLYFKFSGAPESVWIFTTLGAEPWGRFATGIIELVASLLLLIPSTSGAGAMLVVGTMAGAVVTHLFVLGVEVQGDRGTLFALACVALVGALIVLFAKRREFLKRS